MVVHTRAGVRLVRLGSDMEADDHARFSKSVPHGIPMIGLPGRLVEGRSGGQKPDMEPESGSPLDLGHSFVMRVQHRSRRPPHDPTRRRDHRKFAFSR